MTDYNQPNTNPSTNGPRPSSAGLPRTSSVSPKVPAGVSGARPSSIPGTQRRASQIINTAGQRLRTPSATLQPPFAQSQAMSVPSGQHRAVPTPRGVQAPSNSASQLPLINKSSSQLPLVNKSSSQNPRIHNSASQLPPLTPPEIPIVGKTTMISESDLEEAIGSDAVVGEHTDPSGRIAAPAAEPAHVEEPAAEPAAEDDSKVKGQLPIGMKIENRYEITGVLGVGGFATVYKAHHLMIDRDVALKVMDLQKGVDKSYTERFFREAKIAAKIHHNNVVAVYDFGFVAETQQPYIAMEMLRGHDLAHELQEKGPLSPKRAFVLFRPVLDALAEGHRFGIVHKDLKPENLFLTDPGGPHEMMKVLDFGVARIDSGEVAKLTTAGQLLGTPRYLAPEYIKTQLVTPAIDVYQMALILSEALIGVSAASGDPFHAMMLHCQGDLRIADFLLEGEVGKVYKKAICIDHTQRYQNCEEFAQALDTIEPYFESNVPLKGGMPQAVPERRISSKVVGMPSTPTAIPTNASESAESHNAPEGSKNGKKKVVLVLLLLLAIAGIVAVIMTKSGDQTNNTTDTSAAAPAEPAKPPVEEKLTFNFTSEPAGAMVMLGDFELCKTPCSYSFDKNTTNPVTFVLDGYKPKSETLNSTIYGFNKGNVTVKLEKGARPPIKFDFMLTPDNVEADLYIDDKYYGLCKGSCDYDFLPDSAPKEGVTCMLRAKGYKDFTLTLTEDLDPKVKIELEKDATVKRPTTRKPGQPGTNPPETTPTQPAQPQNDNSNKQGGKEKQKIQIIKLTPVADNPN